MRRTYRSKKDTGGGLDHKDVLLTTDEKTSVFNAFYIQNIKQTKRELSCVGSSNHYGITSNKVRKRKYVKKIVKDMEKKTESVAGDSISGSVFLTPDKSIHVKKALDPFDQLLNSSTSMSKPKAAKDDDLFEQFRLKRSGKTDKKKVMANIRKINCSSSDTESDKENSHEESKNVTDLRTHEFLIEKEVKTSKNLEESINNIVKNLSILNNLKCRKASNGIQKTKLNRLTKNLSSPLQNSPLSSTPYTNKCRSKSIYKFSPIHMGDLEKSTKDISDVKPNNMNDSSVIIASKSNEVKSDQNLHDTPVTHINKSSKAHVSSRSLFSTGDKELALCSTNSIGRSKCMMSESLLERAPTSNEESTSKENLGDISSVQTSEVEPFLGFTNVLEDVPEEYELNEKDNVDNSIVFSVNSNVDLIERCSIDNNKTESSDAEEIDQSIVFAVKTNTSKKESNTGNVPDSKYNTMKTTTPVKPFLGFTDNDLEDNENADNVRDLSDDSSDSGSTEINSSYDTCDSEDEAAAEPKREPVVLLDKISNSVFLEYYEKMAHHESANEGSSTDTNTEESGDSESSFENDSNSETKLQVDLTKRIESNSSSDSEYNSVINEEDLSYDLSRCTVNDVDNDECGSFVTTRRRNEATKDSTILVLDDSYPSPSSSDCDKTVLSNKIIDNTLKDCANASYTSIVETLSSSKDSIIVPENNSSPPSTHSQIDSEESIPMSSITTRKSTKLFRDSFMMRNLENQTIDPERHGIVLQPGKKWERSLSIYKRMTLMADHFDQSVLEEEDLHSKGRKYRQSVIQTMEMQESIGLQHNETLHSRRSTIIPKLSRSTIRIVKEAPSARLSLTNSSVIDELQGFLEDCDDTVVELSRLSIADSDHEVTILEKFHESTRVTSARDYVLRRCNQTDILLFDECYPERLLKNCRKIGEGVYGEVFLWRAPDGFARVMKIVPIAGDIKVNGEQQKDYHEIISEIVIAMELSALRAPIADIERHLDEGKEIDALDLHAVENATDVFNKVLTVRTVYGTYPSRLLDLWELYDEIKGSENDNPASLPAHQQYVVLELANAGLDLESYQFTGAEQAYALFLQVAFGLAVAEEAHQFEHRDLHWGNVLIAPTDQQYATFVLRGRLHRVPRGGVAATVIDYSLSRVALGGAASRPGEVALYNDLASDESLFAAVGDRQFEVYRLMREKLGNDWKNFEPYTNILWLHYVVDKMITAVRYQRTTSKAHKQHIAKLKGVRDRILSYGSAAQFVLTDNEY